MRGSHFHNDILVEQPARAFAALGGRIWREYPVRAGQRPQFVDLKIEWEKSIIVYEAEQEPRRWRTDVQKAALLNANLLIIGTPTGQIARLIRRQLIQTCLRETLQHLNIVVLPFGTVLRLLRNKSQLLSLLNVPPTSIQQIVSRL